MDKAKDDNINLEIKKYEVSNFEQTVSEDDVKEVFNKEDDLINYGAKALAQIVNKIKPLKPFLRILGIAKDWGLMQRKIVLYEKEIIKLSEDVKQLRAEKKFNDYYYNSEEFVTSTLFFTDGFEKSNSNDQVGNLRRAYVNMLHNKNEDVNLKSKYIEIASRLTPQHISILGQIIKIFDDIETNEGRELSRNKGVTISGAIRELSEKGMILSSDEVAYLIRELEKNNLVECEIAASGDQYRGYFIAGKTFSVDPKHPSITFTAEELVKELENKKWIDSKGKILDSFKPDTKDFTLNLEEKFRYLDKELIKMLSDLHKEYLNFKKASVSDFVDMALISKPTGFGKKFYILIMEEIYPTK